MSFHSCTSQFDWEGKRIRSKAELDETVIPVEPRDCETAWARHGAEGILTAVRWNEASDAKCRDWSLWNSIETGGFGCSDFGWVRGGGNGNPPSCSGWPLYLGREGRSLGGGNGNGLSTLEHDLGVDWIKVQPSTSVSGLRLRGGFRWLRIFKWPCNSWRSHCCYWLNRKPQKQSGVSGLQGIPVKTAQIWSDQCTQLPSSSKENLSKLPGATPLRGTVRSWQDHSTTIRPGSQHEWWHKKKTMLLWKNSD